ncbi:MAG: hypothetical protein JW892_09350 [Anaerolineae bacterium]|nr:hypothetical protein [Anaerolineae bacterium]
MSLLRRILGILVMLAGILGLLLSLAGLALVWIAKPNVTAAANTTLETLTHSIGTSKDVMQTTTEALGATVDSVDALSAMLATTAETVEESQPVLTNVSTILSDTLPSTLEAATDSLRTAQDAAEVLEGTIQSLETFRFLLSDAPLVGDLIGPAGEPYSPEKPLAESLGELATSLEKLPDTFVEMATGIGATDDNLASVKDNLVTMSTSVQRISTSLSEYQDMAAQSQSSLDDVTAILKNLQTNLPSILNGAALVLTLFFIWLLIAQVVILTQGLELFHGTATRMEGEAE